MNDLEHLHILGVCGTFMGGVAEIARSLGYAVTGSDQNVYPPMSTQLEASGITLHQGWDMSAIAHPDRVLIGNALSRGNAAVEAVLNRRIDYTSGAQWLAEACLNRRWTIAVAGTHGKTTTSSMVAWILEFAGLQPGYLIGGVPQNFGVSARLGADPFFVIEADEYDTAFFDKRSKFVHYRPSTLILNNLEFDHADIFPDLAAIQRQFHHLVRTVPANGRILVNRDEPALQAVLEQGCWSEVEGFSEHGDRGWTANDVAADQSAFVVCLDGAPQGRVKWDLVGRHNLLNALAAVAAARHAGVPPAVACEALGQFQNVKRRLELRGEAGGVRVFDDFAHHPTAIRTTLAGFRAKVGEARILAVLEPRSNTMKMGVHRDTLAASLALADEVFLYLEPSLTGAFSDPQAILAGRLHTAEALDALVQQIRDCARPGDQVLIMSNGGFGGIHDKLLRALQ